MTNEELYMPYAYIKLMPGADKGNVLLYIRNMLNELSPSCLPDFEFCDTFSRHLYEKEIQFGDRVIFIQCFIYLDGIGRYFKSGIV